MNFISNLFHLNDNNDKDKDEYDVYNEYNYKPNMLQQGIQLHRFQDMKEVSLNSHIQLIDRKFQNNEGVIIEGYTNAELSNDYSNKIDVYNNNLVKYKQANFTGPNYNQPNLEGPILNNRNTDYKALYDYSTVNEGCYNQGTDSKFFHQSGMKDVNVNSCKMRAVDLGYSGFSIKKDSSGNNGCYLTNDIEREKKHGLAYKPVVTYTGFSKVKDASAAGLLSNGQVGTYKDNTLVTQDLTPVPGCDKIKGGNIQNTINVVKATFSDICTAPPPVPTYKSIGCYEDKNPDKAAGSYSNPEGRALTKAYTGDFTIQSCFDKVVADNKTNGTKYDIFGLQGGGCFAGNTNDKINSSTLKGPRYSMYGPSTRCQANGLGGAYVNNVYSLGTQDAYVPPPVVVPPKVSTYKRIGCYNDRNPDKAAGSYSNPEGRALTKAYTGDFTIQSCFDKVVADNKTNGNLFDIFGLQGGGCFAGNTNDKINSTTLKGPRYSMYGPSTSCQANGLGGAYLNDVYKITTI
jgi:hypothetical protein